MHCHSDMLLFNFFAACLGSGLDTVALLGKVRSDVDSDTAVVNGGPNHDLSTATRGN